MLPAVNWAQVELVTNILVTLAQGQSSGRIYGNGRNCIPVTVSFYGESKQGGLANLTGLDLSDNIYLVDYNTGIPFPWLEMPTGKQGLFYSNVASKFCGQAEVTETDWTEGSETARNRSSVSRLSDKRASITYYLYGVSNSDLQRQVAAMIKLPNGKFYDSTKNSHDDCKVNIQIWRQVKYRADDLYSTEWIEVLQQHDSVQYTAYIRLRGARSPIWLDFEITNAPTKLGDLYYVSRTTRKKESHLFFLSPLGPEARHTLDKRYGGPFTIIYNDDPGSMHIICVKAPTPDLGEVENYTDDAHFKLYDAYGNIGHFKLDYTDPINPTVDTYRI